MCLLCRHISERRYVAVLKSCKSRTRNAVSIVNFFCVMRCFRFVFVDQILLRFSDLYSFLFIPFTICCFRFSFVLVVILSISNLQHIIILIFIFWGGCYLRLNTQPTHCVTIKILLNSMCVVFFFSFLLCCTTVALSCLLFFHMTRNWNYSMAIILLYLISVCLMHGRVRPFKNLKTVSTAVHLSNRYEFGICRMHDLLWRNFLPRIQ